MLRRRLFVFGVVAFAVGITAGVAEPANLRRFHVARGARIDCANDPGGAHGSPLCRRIDVATVGDQTKNVVTPGNITEDNENVEKSTIDEDDDDDETEESNDGTAVEEGRKKKRRGYLKVFFMMAAAAKATLLYAMIHAVALVAGKALVVAKIALALAAAVALKKALEHQDKTSYEIVKHPHHTYSQTHSASVDYDHHGGGGGGGFEGGHRRRRRHAR